MYYKVKQNNEIVDALDSLQCVCFIGGRMMRAEKGDKPAGVLSSDSSKAYHVEGWEPFPEGHEAETVTLEEFEDQELYDRIMEVVRAGSDFSDFDEDAGMKPAETIRAEPTPMERLQALEKNMASNTMEMTSENGNRYEVTINDDGTFTSRLIESVSGELFI